MIVEEETLPAAPSSIRRSRALVERVSEAAGASDALLFALKLAVDEAVSNVVEHAYKGREDGTFTVRIEADDDRFRIEITDTGPCFDPTAAPAPDLDADWNERTVGGLGLHFVRQVVDDLSYSSDETGNHLVLIKKRTQGPDGPTRRR